MRMFFFKGFDWPVAHMFTSQRRTGAVIAKITPSTAVLNLLLCQNTKKKTSSWLP